jgi:hypothetical protein
MRSYHGRRKDRKTLFRDGCFILWVITRQCSVAAPISDYKKHQFHASHDHARPPDDARLVGARRSRDRVTVNSSAWQYAGAHFGG